MDSRLSKAMVGWSAWEIYQGKRVDIPDVSELYDFVYYPPKVEDSEKQVYLAIGWKGYDIEVLIALGIFGSAALDPTIKVVDVEITRLGGSEIHVLKDKVEKVCFPKYTHVIEKGYFAFPLSV